MNVCPLETERSAFGKTLRVSKYPFPSPSPVRPASFKLFKTEVMDHRARQVPWKSQIHSDSTGQPKPKSFWSWPERHEGPSKHELRIVALLAAPSIVFLAAIDPFTKLANFAAKHLLPQYFGDGDRTTQEISIRIAISIAFLWGSAVIAWIALWAWYQKLVIPQMAGEMLRRGKCVSCRYPIADLKQDSDGCTICPECGSAWKLNAPSSQNLPA